MDGRKVLGIGLITIGIVGAGFLAQQILGGSERIAALERDAAAARDAAARDLGVARAEVDAAREESARLAADLAQVRAAEQETRQALTEAQARADALAAAPTIPPPATVAPPSSTQPRSGGMRGAMRVFREMWENPAMRDQMRAGVRVQVGMLYGDLLDGWALDPQTRGAVEDLLTDRTMGRMELGFLVMDDAISEDEILRKQEEAMARSQEGMAAHLTSMQIAQVDTYEREIPGRMAARQVDQEIAGLGLEAAQREQVRAALLEEQIRSQEALQTQFGGGGTGMQSTNMTRESIRQSRAMFSGEAGTGAMAASLQEMRASQERALDRVRPLMTPEQHEQLSRQREAQMRMIEMGMRMFEGGEE